VVVAVVSWNTRDLLDRCLQSLAPSVQSGTAEVWVVDNASTDGSAAMVRKSHPDVRLVDSQENLGYGRAVNLVAERHAIRGGWDPDRAGRVPWAVGAFLLLRRRAWEQAGGFDPGQWMSAEDLELGWRMRVAGWATRYEPAAVVLHEESAATGEVWGADLPLHWQRCAYAWMVRRRGRAVTVAVGLINLVGSGGRYAVDLACAGFKRDDRLRALGRWTLVHRYALAPQRVLARYR